MVKIAERYLVLKSHKVFHASLAMGVLMFALSLVLNHYANIYTANEFGNFAHDLILDHIPNLNVELVFLEGMLAFIGFVVVLAFYNPHRLPFIFKASALFICVRAFFVILTHLAPPLHQDIFYSQSFLEKLIAGSGDDLFFSGHVGYPFLMALIFWESKPLRLFFLIASIFFALAVLLGHLHYSIDVFSAFFISFGIYHLALRFFKKDYQFFQQEL